MKQQIKIIEEQANQGRSLNKAWKKLDEHERIILSQHGTPARAIILDDDDED